LILSHLYIRLLQVLHFFYHYSKQQVSWILYDHILQIIWLCVSTCMLYITYQWYFNTAHLYHRFSLANHGFYIVLYTQLL
jgi:hypothetical protein